MSRLLIGVGAAAVVAAVAFAVLPFGGSGESPPTAAPQPAASPAEAAEQPAAPAVGSTLPPPVPQAAAKDRRRELQLPDGTFVPALNGAVDPKPLKEFWGPLPWSPIVGVETNDQGVAWYRHQDGSYSTTEMLWDSAGKRHVTLTRVAHPGPAETPAIAPKR
ncbi:MAG: hypothetical protein RL398_2894 [Planctomycetota bacterium]|jgi:hypothetical protein